MAELRENVDSLITIPNERVLDVMGKQATLLDAFGKANDVLLNAVQGISELITRPGLINVDFADVRTVMSEMGLAMMGSATATGENRAIEAAKAAISSPLLEDVNISGARGILINVTAGMDMAIGEFAEVGDIVRDYTAEEATVVIGTVLDPEMNGELRVTLVATGLGAVEKANKPYKIVRNSSKPVDYSNLDSPTVIRNKRNPDVPESAGFDEKRMEYLDIPAFLRRQAD